jgi:hypothetical protein
MSWLRAGIAPPTEAFAALEMGQTASGGWPAHWGDAVASIDATCFRLAELDDLGGLTRPAAIRALDWLAGCQRPDGFWEEDRSLAADAPKWARPGDVEARFYLTTHAAFWLAVAANDVAGPGIGLDPTSAPYAAVLELAGDAIRASVSENGSWPGYLVSGWLAAAILHRNAHFYESARIAVRLAERVRQMSASDVASMAAALRRLGWSDHDSLLIAARERLRQTQRSDGAWSSDDTPAFDVHTTLAGIRAIR